LLLELQCSIIKATLIHCDNVNVVYLLGNHIQHQRTKRIEIDIHFVCEKVIKGQACILHVPSRYQIADIFHKRLSAAILMISEIVSTFINLLF